jgi:hypothetical protein
MSSNDSSARPPRIATVTYQGETYSAEVDRHDISAQLPQALQILASALQLANPLNTPPVGDARERSLHALSGVIDFLKGINCPNQQLEPLKHLFDAVWDLNQDRREDPLLRRSASRTRHLDSTSVTIAKALAGCALEALKRTDKFKDVTQAAKFIARKIPGIGKLTRSDSKPSRTIKEWREALSEARAPDGPNRAAYATIMALLATDEPPEKIARGALDLLRLKLTRFDFSD